MIIKKIKKIIKQVAKQKNQESIHEFEGSDKMFDSGNNLKNHQRALHEEILRSQKVCENQFDSGINFKDHKNAGHGENLENQTILLSHHIYI